MAPQKLSYDLDYYQILEVLPSSSDKEIKKAYRKKALKCHPDKNPDDPQAAEEWEKLAKALEVLADPSAREAYDKVLKAKKAAEIRNQELDSKRKKFKEDLETREAFSQGIKESAADATRRLEREIKRLREEGSMILEEEQKRLKKEVEEILGEESPKLKVKWKSKKGDKSNGGYSEGYLRSYLGKFGLVTHIILSRKKNGSAIVEFATVEGAEHAIAGAVGLCNNPLQLSWLSGRPARSVNIMEEEKCDDFEQMVLERMRKAQKIKEDNPNQKPSEHQDSKNNEDLKPTLDSHEQSEVNEENILQKLRQTRSESCDQSGGQFAFRPFESFSDNEKLDRDKKGDMLKKSSSKARDFETIAMMKLRRAEERRKLIQQMQQDDD